MSLSEQTLNSVRLLNRVATDIGLSFCHRDSAVDLMKLAMICRENVLLLGPPGSGKSELVSRFAKGVKSTSFQYLLTRFTEPAELFGPLDLAAFRDGKYTIITEGMLPKAEIAFLDEVFQASSAILNTLLSLVHERIFNNGAKQEKVPLITLFGASNTLPDDPTLRAFSDRFILRLEIEPVPDDALGELLDKGWALEVDRIREDGFGQEELINPDQLANLHRELLQVNVDNVVQTYQDLVRQLRVKGINLSERRIVKGLKLIRGAALLDGRDEANPKDFWPLNHIWNSHEDIPILRETIQPLVLEAGGPALETHRSLDDLRMELELLESRAPTIRGEGAWTAHLSALGQIRRELLMHHRGQSETLRRVELAIERVMDFQKQDGGRR